MTIATIITILGGATATISQRMSNRVGFVASAFPFQSASLVLWDDLGTPQEKQDAIPRKTPSLASCFMQLLRVRSQTRTKTRSTNQKPCLPDPPGHPFLFLLNFSRFKDAELSYDGSSWPFR